MRIDGKHRLPCRTGHLRAVLVRHGPQCGTVRAVLVLNIEKPEAVPYSTHPYRTRTGLTQPHARGHAILYQLNNSQRNKAHQQTLRKIFRMVIRSANTLCEAKTGNYIEANDNVQRSIKEDDDCQLVSELLRTLQLMASFPEARNTG